MSVGSRNSGRKASAAVRLARVSPAANPRGGGARQGPATANPQRLRWCRAGPSRPANPAGLVRRKRDSGGGGVVGGSGWEVSTRPEGPPSHCFSFVPAGPSPEERQALGVLEPGQGGEGRRGQEGGTGPIARAPWLPAAQRAHGPPETGALSLGNVRIGGAERQSCGGCELPVGGRGWTLSGAGPS